MKEIRDIKIDLLMGNQNPIVDLFNDITKELQIINCDVYNEDGLEFIYFNKEKEWIFYQDAKNGEFWCVYNRYWKIFESEFNFKYEEIQAITKFLVEEALKREVATPQKWNTNDRFAVEEALKREVATPYLFISSWLTPVEEALKREVDTPDQVLLHIHRKVEEALKREVGTPHRSSFWLVEEALKREVGEPNTANRRMVFEVEDALKKTLDKK
jgi:hypothetical protein